MSLRFDEPTALIHQSNNAGLGSALPAGRSGGPRHGAAWSGLETLEPRVLLSAQPTAFEQELLWLINDMRDDPGNHLSHFISNFSPLTSADSDINNAMSFFGVNGPMLQSEVAALTTQPPLAWDSNIDNAAEGHTAQMIAQDTQSHLLPGELPFGDRITAAGYSRGWAYENIYAFGQSALHTHAGFIVDWGSPPGVTGGMQDGRGHRAAIMNSDIMHVGIASTNETNAGTSVGPWVTTQDFAQPLTPVNPYYVGTVWNDTNANNRFDAGEGLSGVSVTAVGASTYNTTSWTAGGYQLQLPAGTYNMTFSGGALGGSVVFNGVTFGSSSI